MNVARLPFKKSVKPSITFLTCLVSAAIFQVLDMLFVSDPRSVKEWDRSLQRMCTEASHWKHRGPATYALIKTFNETEFILILWEPDKIQGKSHKMVTTEREKKITVCDYGVSMDSNWRII